MLSQPLEEGPGRYLPKAVNPCGSATYLCSPPSALVAAPQIVLLQSTPSLISVCNFGQVT